VQKMSCCPGQTSPPTPDAQSRGENWTLGCAGRGQSHSKGARGYWGVVTRGGGGLVGDRREVMALRGQEGGDCLKGTGGR
jgi:hypothetical protein